MPIIETLYSPPQAKSDKARAFYAVRMAFWTLAVSGTYLVHSFFVKTPIPLANRYAEIFARALLKSGHITLKSVDRHKHLDPNQSYMFMSNHPSMMDIPALALAIPKPIRMVSKIQLARIPIFGQAMGRAGFVFVDREQKSRAIHQLEKAKQRVKEGMSVWIAPEGTRSRQEGMRPFKKGGFHLAIELQVPIVPIWIVNTENIMSARHLKVTPNQTATVIFGQPIPTAHLNRNDVLELSKKVREDIFKLRDLGQDLNRVATIN